MSIFDRRHTDEDRIREDEREREDRTTPALFDNGAGPSNAAIARQAAIQRKRVAQRAAVADDHVAEAAAAGIAGPAERLPHGDRIQESFGRHDVNGIRAHVGGEAATASEAIGADAYATGSDVAFRDKPDLHTAAHEAAHVIQQREGVHLAGGVGSAKDAYERHADAVADAVVRGDSAESLLDAVPHAGAGRDAAVQRKPAMGATLEEDARMRQQQREEERLVRRDEDATDAGWGAAKPGGNERTGRRREHVEVDNLKDGFLDGVGELIEAVGGSDSGTELEIKVTARVPLGRLFLTGQMLLKVEHGGEGYKVKARPALGVSVGQMSKKGSAYADLLANYTVEAQAATGRGVLEMVSLALEAECRAMTEEPPPLLLGAFMYSFTAIPGVPLNLDNLDRIVNAARGRGYVSSFWPWLADAVWGEGNMAVVMADMEEGEYAETVDEGSLSGSVSQDAEGKIPDFSGSARVGVGQRRRIERGEGESEASEREDMVLRFKATPSFGPIGGELELLVPLSKGARGGMFKAELSALFDTSDLGPLNYYVDAVLEVIRIAIHVIEQRMKRDGKTEALENAHRQLTVGLGLSIPRDEIYQACHNQIWNRAGELGIAERGFELSAVLDFDSKLWKFALALVDSAEPPKKIDKKLHQSVEVTRKRTFYEFEAGGA